MKKLMLALVLVMVMVGTSFGQEKEYVPNPKDEAYFNTTYQPQMKKCGELIESRDFEQAEYTCSTAVQMTNRFIDERIRLFLKGKTLEVVFAVQLEITKNLFESGNIRAAERYKNRVAQTAASQSYVADQYNAKYK